MSEHATPPLPEVFMSVVETDGVLQILGDIARHAELVSVQLKSHATAQAEAAPPSLNAAREFLAAGTLRGLQVRYRFQGELWTDTWLQLAAGKYRLVRMRAPF